MARLKSALAPSVQSGRRRLWNVCGASVTATRGSRMHGDIMLKMSGFTCAAMPPRHHLSHWYIDIAVWGMRRVIKTVEGVDFDVGAAVLMLITDLAIVEFHSVWVLHLAEQRWRRTMWSQSITMMTSRSGTSSTCTADTLKKC